jgi:EmrB/QacA subfamily drug resistance transporter
VLLNGAPFAQVAPVWFIAEAAIMRHLRRSHQIDTSRSRERVPAVTRSAAAPLVAIVAGGAFLAPINSTMIAVALPALGDEFGIGVADLAWLVIAYLLVMACLQPVAGRLGDSFGHRKLFVAGCFGLLAASVGCALAPSFGLLLACRALQGVAAAVMSPNGGAILRHAIPADRRGRAFGWFAACMTLGAAIGPALGGLLVDRFGPESIFWVNVPVLVLVVPLAVRTLPETPTRAAAGLDGVGAALLTAALVCGSSTLVFARSVGTGATAALGAATVGLAVAFAGWERGHPRPLVDPRLFRHPAFTAASACALLSNLMMYTTLLLIPVLLSELQGRPADHVGWVLVVFSGAMALVSPVGGRLSDRFGRALPVVGGSVLLVAGAALLLGADAATSTVSLLVALVITGLGVGLQFGSLQSAALESAPASMAGVASGVWATSRYIGSIAGSAILAMLISERADVDEIHAVVAVILASGVALLPAGIVLRTSGRPLGLLQAD